MIKFARIAGIVLLLLIVALFVFYMIKNESLPEGQPSAEADAMAERMLEAMNKPAWDSTRMVSWTFRGEHDFEWDRVAHEVTVSWGDVQVRLKPDTKEGIATREGQTLNTEEQNRYLEQAWDFFNNDSFWLAAPYKVFDPGTERSIVTCADGREGLMVTYTSGGTTPGDSYVWILGEDNRPVACKMWVRIIPIGGIEFSWENYETLPSGALVAQDHKAMGLLNVDLTNLSAE